MYMSVCISHSVMSYSLWPMDCSTPRLLCPWNSPGKNNGVGCHSLFQRIFPPRVSYISGRFFTIWATRKAHWVLICLSKQISCRGWGWSYECKVYTEEWVIITPVVSYIHLLSPRALCLKKKWIQVAPRFWNYFLSYFTSLLFFMQLKYH